MDNEGYPIAGGGGGFVSPATEDLDMDGFEITDLQAGTDPGNAVNYGQLTAYNPFNQPLNTTDSVQFQNVNMNGQWNIPNTQPATPNDPNTYSIGARGGIINVPVYVYPKNCIEINLFRSANPPVEIVYLPVPSGSYFYADLADLIKDAFNALPGAFNGIVTCSYCAFFNNKLLLTLNSTMTPPYNFDYQLQGTGYTDDVNYLLGVTNTSRRNYGSPASGNLPVTYSVNIGWYSTSSSFPVQNGSPYIYSASQDKWYTSEILYTPDFLNNFEFSNTQYSINQGVYTKFVMNAASSSLWGPDQSGAIQLFASNIALRQNSVERFIINNAETYSFSPSRLNYSYKSNTELASFFNNINRFSIGPTVTSLTSPSTANTLTINDTSSFIYINTVLRLSTDAVSSTLRSPGASTSLLLEDAGATLQTSGTDYIELTNAAMSHVKNGNLRSLIDNTRTNLYSPNVFSTGGFQLAMTDTDIQMMQYPSSPYPFISRIQVSSTGSTILRSLTGLYSCAVHDTVGGYFSDVSRRRIIANGSSCQMVSPDGASSTTLTDASFAIIRSSVNRLLIDASGTSIYGVAPSLPVLNLGVSTASLGCSGGYSTVVTSGVTAGVAVKNGAGDSRLVVSSAESTLWSPDLASSLAVSGNNLTLIINSINRQIVTSLTTAFYSPSLSNSMVLSNNGNILTCNGSVLNLANAALSYTLAGVQRCLINSSTLKLVSNNTLAQVAIEDTGITTTLDASCTNIITVGGTNKLNLNNFTSSLRYNDTNYFNVSNSSIELVKNNAVRFGISDTAASGFSPSNIMVTALADTLWQVSGGSSTGTKLITTPTDASFILNNVTRIHSDSSHSQLVSPNGLQAVEANNTGVQINLGANNYKLPTTRGTAGQVITADAGGTTSSWATPSVTPGASINSGWGYLPMSAITATATAATRSFYYISMVPMNTVITGIKAYINTPGADFINCAIYRGKNLVAGSTLVMTSGRVTVLSTVDANNYMTLPLTLQAGQSNQFTAGEYVTICYHSSGSGAVYYICAAAPANLGISYISTACYAAAGTPTFPANLSLVTPSTTNTIRTHFEFY